MQRKTHLERKLDALGMSTEEKRQDISQAIQYAKAAMARAEANVCPNCSLDDTTSRPYYSKFARRYTIKWWRKRIQQHEEELSRL